MRKLLVVVLLAAPSIWAAESPEETFEMKNGRFWNHLGSSRDDYKSAFILGLFDGWALRGMTKATVLGKEVIVWSSGPKSTVSDLATMVTSVYEEPENLPLPIGGVVMGAFAVQRGDTTRDLVFMALRKHLAKMLDSPAATPVSEVDPIDVIMQLRKKP
jgi:hypothetical protein